MERVKSSKKDAGIKRKGMMIKVLNLIVSPKLFLTTKCYFIGLCEECLKVWI